MIDQGELAREEQFWDSIGDKWMKEMDDRELRVDNAGAFLSGSSVPFEYLVGQLGDISTLTVLDYGCGSGWLSTYLAKRGAAVKGFDISQKLVELGRRRAEVNGVAERVTLKRMIAEQLEYPDGHFDAIVGISILHHVDLETAGKELVRVLRPGGRALFIEPLGESKGLDWIRNHVFRVHHGHVRVVDAEHPLTYDNIRTIGAPFRKIEYREFQLFEMIARVTGDGLTRALGLHKLDNGLLKMFPSLKKFCRLVVICYTK